ncbi:hypothetical protein AB0N05_05510 [Nocardia sp. NPDC051030]
MHGPKVGTEVTIDSIMLAMSICAAVPSTGRWIAAGRPQSP